MTNVFRSFKITAALLQIGNLFNKPAEMEGVARYFQPDKWNTNSVANQSNDE